MPPVAHVLTASGSPLWAQAHRLEELAGRAARDSVVAVRTHAVDVLFRLADGAPSEQQARTRAITQRLRRLHRNERDPTLRASIASFLASL